MEPIDFYCSFYERLQYREGEVSFVMRPLRKIIRKLAKWHIVRYYARNRYQVKREKSDVIVSLTSFPARIDIVYLVVLSMLHQSYTPKKIILWLSKSQFEGIKIPESLVSLINDVFEIKMVDDDIRSYKKSYYVLKEFPQDNIFLIDDDLFYPTNTIETVLKASKEHPGAVICRFGSLMKYSNGYPEPYNSWWNELVAPTSDKNLFFGTGGGTLIRREYLFDEVDNIKLALSLAPLADDVWMNAMVNLQKTPKYKIKCGLLLPIYQSSPKTLTSMNVGENQNDIQIANVRDYFISNYKLDPFKQLTDS